jgi:hypothetical protein
MVSSALWLDFTRRGYVVGVVLAALLTAVVYAYAGQVVTIFADGAVFLELQPARVAALVILSVLMGVVLPVQVFALRRAA